MLNFKHLTVGNVFLQRWVSQPSASDVEPMLAAMHAASDALSAHSPLVGVSVVPCDLPSPTPAAARAMENRYEELLACAPEAYVVVEPGSFRSARLIVWTVNTILTVRGRALRMEKSVAAALADAKTPLLVPISEVVRRGRAAGLIVGTDEP